MKMKKSLFFLALCAVLVVVGLGFNKVRDGRQGVSAQTKKQEPINKAELNRKMARLQIPFIINQGQINKNVKFYARTFGGTVFITKKGELVYSIPRIEKVETQNFASLHNSQSVEGVSLKEEFVSGRISDVKGEEKSLTRVSYFKGNDQSNWKREISTYDIVSLGEIYNGVELKLRAYGNNVEKLFFVNPGAEPENIRIKLSGGKLNVNKNGKLEIKTKLGTVKFTKPVAYQEVDGKKEFVQVAYVVNGDEYGFKVGRYNRTKELVIDPLLASTFLGEGDFDRARSIAIDSGGNVYVAGITQSSSFPTTTGAFDNSFNGGNSSLGFGDAFVSKLSGDLTTLLASTFLGGSSDEEALSIAISGGDVYVTGFTQSSDFPTTIGAFDNSFNGGVFGDAFVSKLSGDLANLLASTYLGGSGGDQANSIAIDSGGNVYLSGITGSSDFPATSGAFQTSCGTNGVCNKGDAFVSRLSGDLTTLLASTYLGGGDVDDAFYIAINSSGDVYVTGQTLSSDFPVTLGTFQPSLVGGNDVFVSRLIGNLTTLIASTYLGGEGDDGASSMVIDSGGNIYVTGFTGSSEFPATSGAFQISLQGTEDAFVSKLSGDLVTLLASTFLGGGGGSMSAATKSIAVKTNTNTSILGGSSENAASSIALDSGGNVFVTGFTESPNFPTTSGAFDNSCGTDGDCNFKKTPVIDAFVSKLSGDLGNLLASTYLGGGSSDQALSIAVSGGNVYVTGQTLSSDFPTTTGAFQTSLKGSSDAFVSEFDPNLSSGPTSAQTQSNSGSGGGGCAIGGPVQTGTSMANVLIFLVPALAIGLRVMIRKRKGIN